jgi:hypothetical protein
VTPRRHETAPPPGPVPERPANPLPPVAFIPGPAEARLLSLLHEAAAFATQLDMSLADATRLLAVRASDVAGAIVALRAALAEAGALSAGCEAEESIRALLVLLARRAPMRQEGRLEAHGRRIAEVAADLHGDVVATVARTHRRLERPALQALRRFEKAHDELQLRMRAVAAVGRLTRGLRGRELDERRRRLAADLAGLARRLEERRDRLAAQREMSAVLWRELDAELYESVEEVGAELAHLLG